MADPFLILRPYGSGFTMVPTGRSDTTLFTCRVVVGAQLPQAIYPLTVSTVDYKAFITGMSFDNDVTVTSVTMEPTGDDSELWAISWFVDGALGSNAYFDVLFVSTTLCSTVDQADVI